jgi:hypothetical protein
MIKGIKDVKIVIIRVHALCLGFRDVKFKETANDQHLWSTASWRV